MLAGPLALSAPPGQVFVFSLFPDVEQALANTFDALVAASFRPQVAARTLLPKAAVAADVLLHFT